MNPSNPKPEKSTLRRDRKLVRAAAGAAVGGLVAGPAGALAGALVGALIPAESRKAEPASPPGTVAPPSKPQTPSTSAAKRKAPRKRSTSASSPASRGPKPAGSKKTKRARITRRKFIAPTDSVE